MNDRAGQVWERMGLMFYVVESSAMGIDTTHNVLILAATLHSDVWLEGSLFEEMEIYPWESCMMSERIL